MPENPKTWEEIGSGLAEAINNITRQDIQKKLVDPARIRKRIQEQRDSRLIDDTLAKELLGHLSSLTPKRRRRKH